MSMAVMTLNKKTSVLADLRRTRDKIKAEVDLKRYEFEKTLDHEVQTLTGISAKIDETQQTILEELRKDNLMQWKTPDATISRKLQTKYNIVDKDALIIDLAEKELATEYTYIEIKPEVKSLFEGQEFAGVEKVETDYISVLVKKIGEE